MKVVLVTFGSHGDVQPMLAVTLALHQAGHDVLLIGPPEKAQWAAELGCPYHPLGIDVTAFIDTNRDAHSNKSALIFMKYVRNEVDQQFCGLPRLIDGADVVVGASLCFALSSIAEAMRIPYRFILFTPQMLQSRHHPFPAFKRHGFPGWWNMAGWQAVQIADRFNFVPLINQWRIRHGLKPFHSCLPHLLGNRVIVASDPAISSVPSDVKPHTVQTGYFHLDQPEVDLPALDTFLDAGPPPVYAGFGSMPRPDQMRLTPLIIAAARLAGQRVVIGRFWETECGNDAADDVFFIRRYPHRLLFPKMSAIIHHGGAGTTATAAISGVPQIIVPHILDQYYWGDQIFRRGLGPRAIWRSRLTAKNLGHAVASCLADSRMKTKAESVAEKIRQQNPLQQAVQEIWP